MTIIPQKPCSKCGVVKPLHDFYTRKNSPDGYRKECKACFLDARKQHYYTRTDRTQILERMREYSNNRYNNNADRRQYQAEYLKVRRRNDPKFKEMHLRSARAYKKRRNQIDPVYYMKERLRRNCLAHKRRAKLHGSHGSHTAKEWNDLCEKYDHRCLCCGERKPLTKDHIIPVMPNDPTIPSGSDDISNIQPLCIDCNLRKGNRHCTDYRPAEED